MPMRRRHAAVGIISGIVMSIFSNHASAVDRAGDHRDSHSFGNPGAVRVVDVELDLSVDFAAKKLRGSATLAVERAAGAPADAPLWLDTRALAIQKVESETAAGVFESAAFELGAVDPILGSRLTIKPLAGSKRVRVAYETSPQATALQWLPEALTSGKKHPFLFSQSEAIHARSWIPLQDSPGVRVTYRAVIHAPAGLTAVMAADSLVKDDEAKQGLFRFAMPMAIPPYLIALAVGDLAFQALGPRTGVWAEPGVLKSAGHEFADVESMVASVERGFGPYRWGRYDILVLPPSFPFGGMENPKLTFATPTVLAGDRSLVSLIAHELAHSWSGNLVTNATWRDFWLNEGFTTYLERRIVEDLYGRDRAEIESTLAMVELREELGQLPEKDQILHIDLAGRDPDDGMTRIAYEKGAFFLRTIEEAVGRARFDAFLKGYFDHFAFQSITTADFRAYLEKQLFAGAAPPIDLDAWLEHPGLPAGHVEPRSARLTAVDQAAKGWLAGNLRLDQLGSGNWSTQEWIRFLQALPERLTADRMTDLDRVFKLTERGNSEIVHQWLLIAIRNDYKPARSRLESYLTTIGRRKLVLPLYKALATTPEGRKRALEIYSKARPGYHSITTQSVDRLLRDTLRP